MTQYRYRPLPSPSTQIRLLELLPGRGRGKIKCQIKIVTLQDAAWTYEPLSYCWQTSEWRRGSICRIDVEGHDLSIEQNLHEALLQLRLQHAGRILWVDAICINQSDLEERSLQVPLMAQIYGGGKRTLAWLGRADWWTAYAFRCLKDAYVECASRPCLADWEADLYEELDERDGLAVGGNSPLGWARGLWKYAEYLVTYTALGSILGRRYFTRSWIMQEVAMSQEVSVLCGGFEIDWDEMSLGLQLYDYSITGCEYFEGVDYLRRHKYVLSLPEVIKEASRTRATDPRDKLYSILGLVPDFIRGVHLTPNYTLDCDEIFQDFTISVIKATGTLDALSMSRGVSESNTTYEANPSWVWDPEGDGRPDEQLSWPLSDALFPFSAARDSSAIPRFDGSMLGLSGHILDQVTVVGPSYPSRKLSSDRAGQFSIMTSPWEVAELVRLYLASRDVAGLNEDFVDADTMEQRRYIFRRTIQPLSHKQLTTRTDQLAFIDAESDRKFEMLDRELTRRFGALSHRKGTITFLQWLKLWPAATWLILQGAVGNPIVTKMNQFAGKPGLAGRRLVRTGDGRIGLCPQNTKPGDHVALLQGSEVPFVLRAFGKHWKIVGECYIHEVMYGQAWDASRCEILWLE